MTKDVFIFYYLEADVKITKNFNNLLSQSVQKTLATLCLSHALVPYVPVPSHITVVLHPKKIFGNLKFLKIYYLCPNLSFIISFCDSINFMAKKALNRSILGVLDSYVTAVYREKIKKIMTFFLQM